MGKRILVVDDSFGDRLILRDLLAACGHHVVGEARNIEQSLEKYEVLKPDLVLVGGIVPDVDGVSAVMQLLRQDINAVIIVCVTRGQRTAAMEAMRAGAKDFVTKPLNLRQLRRTIHNAFGRPPQM